MGGNRIVATTSLPLICQSFFLLSASSARLLLANILKLPLSEQVTDNNVVNFTIQGGFPSFALPQMFADFLKDSSLGRNDRFRTFRRSFRRTFRRSLRRSFRRSFPR